MDEIRKIPPVTRTVVGGCVLITLGPLLRLINPYHVLLWWPAVLKGQIWRILTCFGLAGGELQVLFDFFMLGRNMLDLEVNHFYRDTADFTWALTVIATLIIAINHPLQSTVLFRPLLSATTYLWARSNPTSSVSLFGLVSVPALLLPYVYMGFDLLQGGLPLAIQSSTGIISAHVYWYLTAILPGERNSQGIRPGPRYLSTPRFLKRLLPPSLDPSQQAQGGQPQTGDPTNSRRMLNTRWGGTAFAPAGRDFNDGRANWAAPGTGRSIGATSSSAASSSSSWTSWVPFWGADGSGSSGAGEADEMRRREKARQDRLDALERRLQGQRDNSIAGRNAAAAAGGASSAAPSSSAGSGVIQGQAGRASQVGTTALRSNAPPTTLRSRETGTTAASKRKDDDDDEQEPLLDPSSSGGAVAEQRRHTDEQQSTSQGTTSEQPQPHQWGSSGRRLGD